MAGRVRWMERRMHDDDDDGVKTADGGIRPMLYASRFACEPGVRRLQAHARVKKKKHQ